MDKDHIIGLIVGFAITGWLSYVTNNVGEAKHERDEMRKDIQYVKIDVGENKEGIAHIWVYNDTKDAKEKEEMKENFRFALDMIDKQHENEIAIKDLEILILKEK
jgi:hypothetical protein